MENHEYPAYLFTTDRKNPKRVNRIELELVNFSLSVTLENGDVHRVTETKTSQIILNKANAFNDEVLSDTTSSGLSSDLVKEQGGSVVEIKLDPVNSVNVFHIPA